jgi:hypothetical protein
MPGLAFSTTRLDYPRNGSVLLTMENSNLTDPNLTAAQDLLARVAEELDEIIGVIASLRAPERIAEILDHSVKATALTIASRTLLSRVQ